MWRSNSSMLACRRACSISVSDTARPVASAAWMIAAVAVAALHREVELVFASRRDELGEADAEVDQPLDALAAVLHGEAHHVLVAQARSGAQRVGDVRVDRVLVVEHGGDAALGPGRGAVAELALADHRDPRRAAQTCSATLRPAAPLPITSTSWV